MIWRENKNPKMWKSVIDATLAQEDILPIIYYKPFKASKLWIKHHFPTWDLSDYTDKFFYAEKYWNVVKLDDNFERDKEYVEFGVFLKGHC